MTGQTNYTVYIWQVVLVGIVSGHGLRIEVHHTNKTKIALYNPLLLPQELFKTCA